MRRTMNNPYADIALRDLYRDENPACEWCLYLGMTVEAGKLKPMWEGLAIDAAELNHLWSVGRRPDVRSNFIMLEWKAHRWFHDHIQEGRLMSVLAKLRKREGLNRPDEFSLDEMLYASGKLVAGVIESYSFDSMQFVKWQAECLDRLKAVAA